MPSEYVEWLSTPGYCAGVFSGPSDSSTGNVTGSLPDGFTSPNSRSLTTWPSSWPGNHVSSTPGTDDSHGMVVGPAVCSTTTVCGLAAATAATSASSSVPSYVQPV